MRKFSVILFIFLIFFATLHSQSARAVSSPTPDSASPTPKVVSTFRKPTATPTQTPEDSQIERIKDLVASKVAELKLVDKRGLLGKVKDASSSQIVLTDIKNSEVMVDIDELTKFESADKESFGISDIKKGDFIAAIGLYNKETERLLARFISLASNVPVNIEGVVVDQDKINYMLTIVNAQGQSKTVDIESSTKTTSFEDGEQIRSGFSKIAPGDRVIIVGFMDKKIPNQINASRIVRLPQIALSEDLKAQAAKFASQTPTPEPSKKR